MKKWFYAIAGILTWRLPVFYPKFEPLGTLPVPGDTVHYVGKNRYTKPTEWIVSEIVHHYLGAPVRANVLHVHFVQLTPEEDHALCMKHNCSYIGQLDNLPNSFFEGENTDWRVQKRKRLIRSRFIPTEDEPIIA